jgi:hypothetical protein
MDNAPRTVLGYFTLAMASVPCDTFPKTYVRGLPPYDLPLILLARLAVDRRFAGRGLDHALISEALRISLRVANEVGCRCIITDAYRDRVSRTTKDVSRRVDDPRSPSALKVFKRPSRGSN